jgi:hypothetical protein
MYGMPYEATAISYKCKKACFTMSYFKKLCFKQRNVPALPLALMYTLVSESFHFFELGLGLSLATEIITKVFCLYLFGTKPEM